MGVKLRVCNGSTAVEGASKALNSLWLGVTGVPEVIFLEWNRSQQGETTLFGQAVQSHNKLNAWSNYMKRIEII